MATIVACYKWVLDEEDLVINPDRSIDVSHARGKISEFDKSAIEATMQVAAQTGDATATLTFGTPDVRKSLKDALSRGPATGYWVGDAAACDADALVTSQVLASAIRTIDGTSLVICAEGASDTYARQIAPRVGALLDWPTVTSVIEMKVEGDSITATRKLDGCLETVTVNRPCVIAVLPAGYEPPIPGLKAVLSAGKKPLHELGIAELGCDPAPAAKVLSSQGFIANRRNVIFVDGDASDKVTSLVSALKKEGMLS